MSVNQKIVRYAQGKLDRVDGNGECWTLAYNALKAAAAVVPSGNGASLYVWGTRVPEIAGLQPGNIIQFTNYNVKVTQPDGSWATMSRGGPRHTAIVESVGRNGQVTVLESNVEPNSKKTVRTVLYLTSGTISGATVEVTGSFIMYRAVAQ